MEILGETGEELIVRGSERVLILNRKTGTISGLHAQIAKFDKVRSVKICIGSDDDTFGKYSVLIYFGIFSSIYLGYTDSEICASSMAAKLSTWIGKPVVC